MFSCQQRIQRSFFKEEHTILRYFQACFFRAESFQSILRIKKVVGGSGGMLHREIFENLHTVVVIFVLFEQRLGKFCLNFLPINLSVSPNMMHFVHTFSIMRA